MPARDPPNPEHRIAKLLARAGIASRREIERMIVEGRIAKDGVALDTPATLLRSLDGVTVDGQPVAAATPARLFLYHKPAGLLVTERDPSGRPTIYDRMAKELPRVVPVGRLDLNTEGLLLLTTDGELKRQLELPATGVERAYRARAYGQVSQAQLESLIEGVEIEGFRYGSINANLERRTGANVWIEMVLTEGKNREVRRVLEYLGLRVSRLIRTRYGPFVLGDLPPGEVGEVRGHDVASFRKNPTKLDLPQPARTRASGSAPPSPRSERPSSPAPTGAARPSTASRPDGTPPASAATPRTARPAGAPRPGQPAAPAATRTGPKPKSPGKPKPASKLRVRADGSVAVKLNSTRAARATAFRKQAAPQDADDGRPPRARDGAQPARTKPARPPAPSSGQPSSRGGPTRRR